MEARWFALYTKSRHEAVTYNELLRKGIEAYLPMVKKLRQWKDRKKYVDFPLFPGYLFVKIPPYPDKLLQVLKTKGAVTFVSHEKGRPAEVPEEEIQSLKLLVQSGRDLNIYPHLKEGTTVRIRRGKLEGAVGIIEKKEDQYIFVINITLLGKSISVPVYADDLELV